MRRTLRFLAALLGALFATALPADLAAAADPLAVLSLRAQSGESAWNADRRFRLEWDREDPTLLTTAAYRLYDESGARVGETVRTPWGGTVVSAFVPATPGAYTAEVWLESSGREGPHAFTTLRFDDVPPGQALPVAPSGWVAADSRPAIAIRHPAGPQPLSGIRGYAVSVERDRAEWPCAAADRCTLAETDLRGGIEDDAIRLGTLLEGVNHVTVLAVSGSGVSSREAGGAVLRVDATPPEVALGGAPQGWARGPVQMTATASDALSGMAADGPGGPFTAIAVDGRAPLRFNGAVATGWVSGDGVHEVAYVARDAAGNVADGTAATRTAAVRIDETPPRVAFAARQDPGDPELIEATVADDLSGPSPAKGSIAIRPAGSAAAFEPLPTTVSAGRLVARWDSGARPAGRYELLASAWDLAGNSASSRRRVGGAEMVLVNPLKEAVSLEAGFGGRRLVWHRCSRRGDSRRCRREAISDFALRPDARTVPYGRGVAYGGRLVSASGRPVAGAEVAILEDFAPGAVPPRRTTIIRSDAEGFFLARLAPGPSREITASFAGDRRLGRGAAKPVWLSTLSGVALRASSSTAAVGGRPVLFRGRVSAGGAAIPSLGRPVELQFRYPGAEWSEFRGVQTDARGRFRLRYAFSDDDSRGIRFQFRAHVPPQPGWPYEPAASRPVAVTGK